MAFYKSSDYRRPLPGLLVNKSFDRYPSFRTNFTALLGLEYILQVSWIEKTFTDFLESEDHQQARSSETSKPFREVKRSSRTMRPLRSRPSEALLGPEDLLLVF